MTTPARRRRSGLIAIVVLLLPELAGCGGIFSQPPQRQLYRLTPNFAFPAGLPPVAAQLVVGLPTAPSGLDTARIALSRSPVSLDYYADAEWTDRLPALVQGNLVEGFEKSAAIPAVGPESLGLRADFELETEIRDFEAVYDSPGGPPHVLVRFNAKLVRLPERKIVAQTSVSRQEGAAAGAIPEVVRAFDGALGGAVQQVVMWTLANPALSSGRGSAR